MGRTQETSSRSHRTREREKLMKKEWEKHMEREREDKKDIRKRRDDDDNLRDHHHRKRPRRDTEDGKRKSVEDLLLSEKKVARSQEEEQRKLLDEEMEKRRRRLHEWQELKRMKNQESDRQKPTAGRAWTLDGESDGDDDEEALDGDKPDTHMLLDKEDRSLDDSDPLDAFMNSMVLPQVSNAASPSAFKQVNSSDSKQENNGSKRLRKSLGRIIPGEDSSSDYEDDDENPCKDEDDDEFMKRVKKTKADKILTVDHSKIEYPSFRKNFYIEVKEISRMTPEEVAAYRKQLELKIHGKDVPKPVRTWHQMGLSTKIINTIKKLNFEKPMPIQAQALPIIMSGRDCIGVAKTGSGKTLAYILPMLRHIKAQPPILSGDGPIGLILAPTRELVQQIHWDIKKLSKVMGLTSIPVYGGSGVAQQISELKRGPEIVVCTPGRMIDILCTSGGKITNLRRVTYLVIDEADRMFDMGFEPQITRIVQNTQPGRQTVLFSATFPRQVEMLACKVLNKPVEIQVGGRSVVNKDITQMVEVRPENERFLRLLELLGEWSEKGKILVFVHTQEKCDGLFRSLLKHGYPCLSLHGAKDQTDRESTISDFKSNVCNLLIATSVAARGLDVKELELVINYDAPNHYEDYVHRVGRTGRAGKKGCAITFVSEDDARYAPDLVKALELSEQVVPDDLKALKDGFMAKVNQGLEQVRGSGYGGSGFKFNEEEDEVRKSAKKAQAKEYGFEEDESDSEDEDEGVTKAGGDLSQQGAFATASKLSLPAMSALPGDAAARAVALAAAMNLQYNLAKIQANAMPEHYEAELEINDFPHNTRYKVRQSETLGPISEWTGADITTKGQYYPPGQVSGPGDRKLYLLIKGPTEQSVKRAKSELKRVLEDITTQGLSLPGSAQPGRYSVL